ncbi:YciI family protein [Kitasatospora saccharophila]|uniref:YciI family protein n=1 Tax=Kitasatospora saccharophila TaxID=407973 RepID=A0ABN2W8M2_9ACTN
MFIVTVTYTAGPQQVDPVRPEHGDWLRDLIDRGLLLAAGRRTPLVGGVYLVPASARAELDAVLAGDPYLRHGVAAHEVVEFTPLLTAPGLEALADA